MRKTVTASFPLYNNTRHFSLNPLSDQEKLKGIRQTLLGGAGENSTSLLEEFVETLGAQTISGDNIQMHVGVSDVEVQPEAIKWLPQQAKDSDGKVKDTFKEQLAGIFSRWLSKNQELSVVPYRKDGALGQTMTAVFVNGDVENFKLPEKNFVIKLNLKEFMKILLEEESYAIKYLYGAYLGVEGGHNGFTTPDMDITFKQGLERVIPADKKGNEEDWLAFYEVLDEMVYGITSELKAKPDKKWLKSHTYDKHAAKQIKEFSEKLEKCK